MTMFTLHNNKVVVSFKLGQVKVLSYPFLNTASRDLNDVRWCALRLDASEGEAILAGNTVFANLSTISFFIWCFIVSIIA